MTRLQALSSNVFGCTISNCDAERKYGPENDLPILILVFHI
jgi:hypothetical protein